MEIAEATKKQFCTQDQEDLVHMKPPPRAQRRQQPPQVFMNRHILNPTTAELPITQPWRTTSAWATSTPTPVFKIPPTREETQQAEHQSQMRQPPTATPSPSTQPTQGPTSGPSLSTVNMQSLDEIKVELSNDMQKHLDNFQRTFLDQVQENVQSQV